MAKWAGLLLVLGCSAATDPHALACGWVAKGTTTLGADACWLVVPARGIAAAPLGADECDASNWQGPHVWAAGETLTLWAKLSTTGHAPVHAYPVACEYVPNP